MPAPTAVEKRYETLRTWRNKLAKKENLRPFRIFSNQVLREIATRKPSNKSELIEIFGIGPSKLKAYGKQVLRVLKR